jgi:hypothetical protein
MTLPKKRPRSWERARLRGDDHRAEIDHLPHTPGSTEAQVAQLISSALAADVETRVRSWMVSEQGHALEPVAAALDLLAAEGQR